MAAGYDGTIKIDTSISGKGFNGGIKSMVGSLKGLAVAVGVAFGIGAVVAFGKAAVQAASEIQNAFIGLESIVKGQGRSFDGAKAFINSYIADGLVPAANAVTAYKNLLMRGYDTSQIEAIMNALKNSAAFGRQSSLTVGQAVQSAAEGLKNENSILVDNAGVTKNVSMMWKDYAASIGTGVGSLTQAQKRQAEFNGIMYETRFQMGDAAKLSNTYSGRISALGVSFQNLKVAIGNSIIPIINQILPYIKMAVDALVIFFNKVAQIINLLFGTNVSMADTADGMGAVADGANAAAAAQDNLAGSTKDAAKAAKGSLAAFDQINVLQQQDPAAATGGGSGAGTPALGGGGLGGSLPEVPKFADDANKAFDALIKNVEIFKIKFMQFIQPVTEALSRLRDALIPLGKTIWSGLKWAWDNILVPLGTWTITELLPTFLDLLAQAADTLNTALIALQPLGIWLWENFLQPMAEWTGKAIILALQWLTKQLGNLSVWINNNQTLFSALAAVLAIVVIALYAFFSPMGTFIAFWAIVIALVVTLVHYWPVLTEAVKNAWARIMQIISPVVAWMTELFTRFFSFATNMWNVWLAVVKNILLLLWLYFKTTFIDPITNLLSLFGLTWSNVWEGLKTGFGTVMDWLGDKFTKVFNAFKPIAKGVVNFIIDILNGLHAGFVKTVNGIIGGANKLGGKLPGWSIIPNISAMQIPHLATGAIIPPNARFAAILGDQKSGRNLEAPEGLIRQIVREESGGGGSKDIVIRFEGSMAQFVRELKPFIDNENKRVGGSLLSGGLA